jgi:hypothetical protein
MRPYEILRERLRFLLAVPFSTASSWLSLSLSLSFSLSFSFSASEAESGEGRSSERSMGEVCRPLNEVICARAMVSSTSCLQRCAATQCDLCQQSQQGMLMQEQLIKGRVGYQCSGIGDWRQAIIRGPNAGRPMHTGNPTSTPMPFLGQDLGQPSIWLGALN